MPIPPYSPSTLLTRVFVASQDLQPASALREQPATRREYRPPFAPLLHAGSPAGHPELPHLGCCHRCDECACAERVAGAFTAAYTGELGREKEDGQETGWGVHRPDGKACIVTRVSPWISGGKGRRGTWSAGL